MSRVIRSLSAMAIVLGLCLVTAGNASEQEPGATLVKQQKTVKKKVASKTKKGTAAPAEDMPKPDAASAAPAAGADSGGLKFSRDIAPILVANCAGCHKQAHRSELNQTTFAGLLKGGKSGPAIVAMKPEESLLVSRIKGEEGAKMPPGNRDLSAASIAKIETWIKEGARLDAGIVASAPMASYAASPEELRRQEIAKMSPDDRDKKTEATGLARLTKADPKAQPDVQKGTSFLLFSKLPKERATSLLKGLDGQFTRVNRILSADKPRLNFPEKVSVYLFKDRASYVEFVRSIENQDVEASEYARAKLTAESPYLIAIDPLGFGPESASSSATSKKGGRSKTRKASDEASSGPERSLAGLLTEAFAAGAVAQAGGPLWVSQGLGAFLGAQVEPGSPYYRKLRMSAYEQYRIGWTPKATEALGGQAKGENSTAVGLAMFEWLSANASPIAFSGFVQGMLQGQGKLDDCLQTNFNMTREEFLVGSAEWVGTRYGRGR